jgi:hypothetical protein
MATIGMRLPPRPPPIAPLLVVPCLLLIAIIPPIAEGAASSPLLDGVYVPTTDVSHV